jgi:hypothetical protein
MNGMNIGLASLRRRAACAALTPVLGEDALIAALQLQQQTLSSDGITAIIGFIDGIAERNGLDAATRKRLYRVYHEALHRPEAELPLDPWPAMQAAAPAPVLPVTAAASPALTGSPGVPSPPEAPSPPPPPTVADAPFEDPAIPAEQRVFAVLMRALLEGMRQSHAGLLDELRQSSLGQLPRLRSSPQVREQVRAAWNEGEFAHWLIAAGEGTLAELVNQVYVALCETLGPIDADRLLTEAVREAQRSSAARSFSPRRLV